MANNLTGSVHTIDTVGVVTTNSTTIRYIRWVSKAAIAGDDVLITDAAGRTIWESVAPGGNYTESDYPNIPLRDGYIVSALDSGKLYIIVS